MWLGEAPVVLLLKLMIGSPVARAAGASIVTWNGAFYILLAHGRSLCLSLGVLRLHSPSIFVACCELCLGSDPARGGGPPKHSALDVIEPTGAARTISILRSNAYLQFVRTETRLWGFV